MLTTTIQYLNLMYASMIPHNISMISERQSYGQNNINYLFHGEKIDRHNLIPAIGKTRSPCCVETLRRNTVGL